MQYVIYQLEYQKALKAQVESILNRLHNDNFQMVSEYLVRSYEDGYVEPCTICKVKGSLS